MRSIAAAVSFFFFLCPPAFGQPIDENRLVMAKRLIELTRATEAIESMMPAMIEQQMSARLVMGKVDKLTDTQQAALDEAADEFSAAFISAMQPLLTEMANVYAQEFSVSEMQKLIEFYESDLGQRLVEVGIELEAEFAAKRQAWARGNVIPAAQKLSEKIKAALASPE